MMDAIKYFKNKKRMTDSFRTCAACPFSNIKNGKGESCCNFEELYPEEAVRIVEEWSKAHPIQTRREKFIEVFGEDPVNNLMEEYVCPPASVRGDIGCALRRCDECSSTYWDAPYEAPKGE